MALSIAAQFLSALSLFAGQEAPIQTQEKEGASYDAVASPLLCTTVKFGYNDTFRGIITYVAAPGSVLRGASFGIDGKLNEPGDVLVHMETDYRQSVVDGKQALYRASCATLQTNKANYERYERLVRNSATSMEEYQHVESAYLEAIGNNESAKADLKLAQIICDACVFRVPFDAVVDSVFFPAGLCAGELDVVKISKLSPMGVKIKMSREDAIKLIDSGAQAIVSPCGSSSEPAPAIPGLFQLTPDGIVLQVANRPLLPESASAEEASLPLCSYETVLPVYYRDGLRPDSLSVPGSAIVIAPEGAFVWRVKGGLPKNGGKGKAVASLVEKVLISKEPQGKPGDLRFKTISVNPDGPLKPFDVILSGRIPDGLSDGAMVRCWKPRYVFMPDDPLKVSISSR